MYKVKTLKDINEALLQKHIKKWVESRNHIQIVSVNVWCDNEWHYATIIYREVQYIG